jgi:hypothetical protein
MKYAILVFPMKPQPLIFGQISDCFIRGNLSPSMVETI